MMNYSKLEVFNIIKNILKIQFPDEKITKTTNLKKELKADGLDLIEILMEIEDEFELNIPDKKADKWETVENILTYLCKELNIIEPIKSRFDILDIR
ncbi:MAG TPA: phosphopantetheine-binding protein [Candidatus Paceibacterota bacterium]|nr:phosphopantetheine-binding protein [Candidatus Paceibacterota bacterium]